MLADWIPAFAGKSGISIHPVLAVGLAFGFGFAAGFG
jgi:nitrate reductase NapE component